MLNSNDLINFERTVAVFTAGFNFSPIKIADRLSGVFDGEPTILPTPQALPGIALSEELPRLVLASSNGLSRLQSSAKRFDLTYQTLLESGNSVSFVEFSAFVRRTVSAYAEATGCSINRIGVGARRAAFSSTAAADLAILFCKPSILAGPLRRPEDFELHSRKRYLLKNKWDINSWIRFKTGHATNTSKKLVAIEQDLNTAPEAADNTYEPQQVLEFVSDCFSESDSIVKIYLDAQ